MIVFKKDDIKRDYSFRIKGKKFVIPSGWYCEVPDAYRRSIKNNDALFILPENVMLADQEMPVKEVVAKKHIPQVERVKPDRSLQIEKLMTTINNKPRVRLRSAEEALAAQEAKNEKGVDKTLDHKKAVVEKPKQIKKSAKKIEKKAVKKEVKKDIFE